MPTYPPLRGIIFDMDGVLVDSEPFIKQAAIQMFRDRHHATVQPDDFNPFVGAGEDRFLGGVAEKYHLPFDLARDKAATYDLYLKLIQGKLHPLPGAIDYVRAARARGLKLAIASSADAVKVQGNLHEIGLPPATFDAIVTGSDVTRKKPHPDIFLRAAELLQLPPQECLVIEDAPNGLRAAQAAGCRTLGLATTFHRDEIAQHHPDYQATDLSTAPRPSSF